MLSLSRVTARQGQSYDAQENYYTQDRTVENSEWQGIGAERLGMRGRVVARDFQKLLEGVAPGAKQRLNADGDTVSLGRRAGIDLTFSAPKSVSVAALVGCDARLEEAHREAVSFALSIAEERYSVTRTGNRNSRREEVAGNIIAAKFHHDTSRQKDPQMHTHCVVINAVQRADGEWRSLHNDAIFNNPKLLGLIYQNELGRRVRDLGYAIEVKSNGTFEIAGYTEKQLEIFSKRREQLEAMGVENQLQARTAVKRDRPNKGRDIPRDKLMNTWLKEANEVALSHPIPKQELAQKEIKGALDMREVVRVSARHSSEKDVSFRREQLERFALESHLGEVSWNKLQQEFVMAEKMGAVVRNEQTLWTTEEAILREKRILDSLQNGKNACAPILENALEVIAKKHPELGKGQAEAVSLTLQNRDQFFAWQGVAGAGKTYAMKVVREFAAETGTPLRGFAPSAEAAKVLEKESGIMAQTVAGCLAESLGRTNNRKGEVWIVDEAGLLSARDCERMMQRAQILGARIAFVGDTRQLSAVEAGNPFRLMQRNGIETASLTESRRQKNEHLKKSVDLMANGMAKEALANLTGQLVELKRESTRAKYITKEYMTLNVEAREKTLILAGTNRERAVITDSIRAQLKADNLLGNSKLVMRLKAKDMSREEMTTAAKFSVGDELVFHQAQRRMGIQNNERCEVVKIDESCNALTLKKPDGKLASMALAEHRDCFLVYEKQELEVACADKLKWTRNDRKHDIRNGEECSLIAAEGDVLRLQKSDGKIIERRASEPMHIDHNYVHTVFSSQGKTCDRVLISVDQTFGQEAMYVALSRARFEVKIITPNKEEMLTTISQSRAKLSALEVVPEQAITKELGEQLVHQNQRQKMR